MTWNSWKTDQNVGPVAKKIWEMNEFSEPSIISVGIVKGSLSCLRLTCVLNPNEFLFLIFWIFVLEKINDKLSEIE